MNAKNKLIAAIESEPTKWGLVFLMASSQINFEAAQTTVDHREALIELSKLAVKGAAYAMANDI